MREAVEERVLELQHALDTSSWKRAVGTRGEQGEVLSARQVLDKKTGRDWVSCAVLGCRREGEGVSGR